MALFFWWAIRSVGLFHAAAKGKEFSESVARAKEAIWTAAESAATKISNHDARVLELVRQVDQIADRRVPLRAQRTALERNASLTARRASGARMKPLSTARFAEAM